jgi:hypothetical protein
MLSLEVILHSAEEEEVIWSEIWLVKWVSHDRFLVQNLCVCEGVLWVYRLVWEQVSPHAMNPLSHMLWNVGSWLTV